LQLEDRINTALGLIRCQHMCSFCSCRATASTQLVCNVYWQQDRGYM